jgi:hypothetical protein
MYIIIHLDIKISIPLCNCSGEENFCFGRQLMITFNMFLQYKTRLRTDLWIIVPWIQSFMSALLPVWGNPYVENLLNQWLDLKCCWMLHCVNDADTTEVSFITKTEHPFDNVSINIQWMLIISYAYHTWEKIIIITNMHVVASILRYNIFQISSYSPSSSS